jgi:hypothetical protein
MARHTFPRNVIVRYADALTDAPSSITTDTLLRLDGRWNNDTVRRHMMQAAADTNTRLARDRYAHPVYAMGYEAKGADGGWHMHPMPYVESRHASAWVAVPADRPGVVVEALVIRTMRGADARIEVHQGGELCGWVTRMVPIVDRRVTTGWSIVGRANNGQPDELQASSPTPLGKAHAFDETVRAIVRRYRQWA